MRVGEDTTKKTSRWVGLVWGKGIVVDAVSRIDSKISCILLVEPKTGSVGDRYEELRQKGKKSDALSCSKTRTEDDDESNGLKVSQAKRARFERERRAQQKLTSARAKSKHRSWPVVTQERSHCHACPAKSRENRSQTKVVRSASGSSAGPSKTDYKFVSSTMLHYRVLHLSLMTS
ncbi:hypothetical protein EDD17DRAFT_1058426 [Pisolithus thermaeus]|nr:hypothetical protein EDD17DRAFT_1058426 [Pisolithus thermaeus]